MPSGSNSRFSAYCRIGIPAPALRGPFCSRSGPGRARRSEAVGEADAARVSGGAHAGWVGVQQGAPLLEAGHVDSGEPGLGRRLRRRAGPERRAVRPARADDPAGQAGRSAAHHRHAASAGRPVPPGAHRLPVAPPAAAPGLPALADDLRLHARLRERGRLGGDPPPPRADAARTRRPGAQPHRRDRRHPERQDDGKGGPRGYDAAKKVWGRKRHVAVDTAGLLLGVIVHAADVQDADGVGDLLRRLKRLYPWLKAVFADGAYDRLPALLARFLLGLTLIVVRRLAGSTGFVPPPGPGWRSGRSAGSAAGAGWPGSTRRCPRSPRPWSSWP